MVSDQNYSRNILWSYEIVILAYPNNKKVLIWIGQLDDKHENSINQQVQQGEFKVMFWGCFSRNTYGPLVEVRWPKIPGFDQDSYWTRIGCFSLSTYIPTKWRTIIYLQISQELYDLKTYCYLGFATSIPRFNPIQNLWAIMKQKLEKNLSFPKNKGDLIERVMACWDELSPELRENLADCSLKRDKEGVKFKRGCWEW